MDFDMNTLAAMAAEVVAAPKALKVVVADLIRKIDGLVGSKNSGAEIGQIFSSLGKLPDAEKNEVLVHLIGAIKADEARQAWDRVGLASYQWRNRVFNHPCSAVDNHAGDLLGSWMKARNAAEDIPHYKQVLAFRATRYLAPKVPAFEALLNRMREEGGQPFGPQGEQNWETVSFAALYGEQYCEQVFNPAHRDKDEKGPAVQKYDFMVVEIPEVLRDQNMVAQARGFLKTGGEQKSGQYPFAHTRQVQPALEYIIRAGMTDSEVFQLLELMVGYAQRGLFVLDMEAVGRLLYHRVNKAEGIGSKMISLLYKANGQGSYDDARPGFIVLGLLAAWAKRFRDKMSEGDQAHFDSGLATFKANLGIKENAVEALPAEEPLPVENKKKAKKKRDESNDGHKPRAPKPEVNDRRLRRQEEDGEDEGGVGVSSGEGVAPSLPRQVVVNNAMATQLAALGLGSKQ